VTLKGETGAGLIPRRSASGMACELLERHRRLAWRPPATGNWEVHVKPFQLIGIGTVVSFLLLGTTGLAQSSPATSSAQAIAPAEFVRTVANGGAKEVELGKMAAQKAANADVKAFGSRMVADHSKSNQELAELAKKKGWKAAPDPSAYKADVTKLSALSGAAFDRAYMDMMVADHQKNVSLFEAQAKSGSDPDLKAAAAKKLPTLQEHLKQARAVQAKLGR
jgi:putative membrane protein